MALLLLLLLLINIEAVPGLNLQSPQTDCKGGMFFAGRATRELVDWSVSGTRLLDTSCQHWICLHSMQCQPANRCVLFTATVIAQTSACSCLSSWSDIESLLYDASAPLHLFCITALYDTQAWLRLQGWLQRQGWPWDHHLRRGGCPLAQTGLHLWQPLLPKRLLQDQGSLTLPYSRCSHSRQPSQTSARQTEQPGAGMQQRVHPAPGSLSAALPVNCTGWT